MSSMDATHHDAQDLIYALQNTAPAILLVKLGHGHKEALKTLANIFIKANPLAVPPRVPIKEVGQRKIQEMNQEGTKMKRTLESNPVTNAEPLRVHIVGAYPYELQPLNQAKNSINFQPIKIQHLTAKSENFTQNELWKIKAYTLVPLLHVKKKKKNNRKRVSPEG